MDTLTMPPAKDIAHPEELIGSRAIINGASGAGKSYVLRRLLEQTHGHMQHLVLDVEDELFTLRERYDYVLIGGDGADAPITEETARQLARTLLELGVSAILQLNDLGLGGQRRLIGEFISGLMAAPKSLWHPTLVTLDEAHRYCLDADTELLTDDGWISHEKIRIGTRAVCFDLAKEQYAYGEVSDYFVRWFVGEAVTLRSDGIDCVVTPDHRVVLRREQRAKGRYKLYPWTFCSADHVPTQVYVPRGGAPFGPGVPGLSLETCRILGWVLTDGSILNRNDGRARGSISIEQSHVTRKCDVMIADAMSTAFGGMSGVREYERLRASRQAGSDPHRIRCWYVNAETSAEILRWLGGALPLKQERRVPRLIIREASREQLEALFQGLMEGDGTSTKHGWTRFYPGKCEGLADDLQEIALRLGYSASKWYSTTQAQWWVKLSRRRHHAIRRAHNTSYNGAVWDITVPTGAFVARRNGKAFVTGN
jgi:hypothetical protein